MLTKIEKKLIRLIEEHIEVIFCIAVLLAGLWMRIGLKDYRSGDYDSFLALWYDQIVANGRLKGLGTQVGDYNIPYQVCIALMSYLPIDNLYGYKLLSILFDFLLAFYCGKIVAHFKSDSFVKYIVFALVWGSPLVVLNSAAWAQCDSIYAAFVAMMIYSFLKDRNPIISFVLLGLGFSFKLQTVFIVPFVLLLYVVKKRFSLLHFGIVPVVMFLASLPAILVGRKVSDILKIYVGQTGTYKKLTLNYPSFIAFLHRDTDLSRNELIAYDSFAPYLIFFTMLVLIVGACYAIRYWNKKNESLLMLYAAMLSCFTCVYFLPAMHERYGYIAEVLSIVLAVVDKKSWKYALLVNGVILIHYGIFLGMTYTISVQLTSIVNFCAYALYCRRFVMLLREE